MRLAHRARGLSVFADRARRVALECADKLENEARQIGICRSVDATESSQWLHQIAAAIREATKAVDVEQPENTPDG